jgi:hypothetical protein
VVEGQGQDALPQSELSLAQGLRQVLVVLSDQIRSPTKIQNRRSKQTYNTYAFTIDIVPLVLEI